MIAHVASGKDPGDVGGRRFRILPGDVASRVEFDLAGQEGRVRLMADGVNVLVTSQFLTPRSVYVNTCYTVPQSETR